jgi:hypothetical protein
MEEEFQLTYTRTFCAVQEVEEEAMATLMTEIQARLTGGAADSLQ